MLINWFTVVAQVVNFLLLVVALKLLLFDRVVAAMDQREANIAARIGEAERREADAEEEAAQYQARRRELEEHRRRKIEEAEAQAASRRSELLEEARSHVEELRTGWEAALHRDRRHVLEEVRRRTGEQVWAVSRQALADLADADLEAQVVRVALRRLDEAADELEPLVEAAEDEAGPVHVRSAFAVDEALGDELRKAVVAALGCDEDRVELVRDPSLVCGLEIQAGSWTVGWNVDSYLDAASEELATLLPPADEDEAAR